MQKRNLYSLLLISFIAVFAASMAFANSVTFETKNVARCTNANGLIQAIVTADSISAVEIIVEVSGDANTPVTFTWDAGFAPAWTKVVDDTSGVDGVLPDTFRIAAMLLNPSDGALAAGTYTVGRINFGAPNMCTGTVNLMPAVFDYPIPAAVQTQFVNAATSTILPVVVTNGVISIVNQAPALAAVPNATLPFGATFTTTLSGSDPDACERLRYFKVSGPAALTVVSTTGVVTWITTGADVCENPVTVKVVDSCGAEALRSFTVTVTNQPPVIACTNPAPTVLGDVATGTVNSTDPDGGPGAPLYSVISFNGPGVVTMNPATGVFTWPTVFNDANYLGTFELCVSVTDGANLCPASPSNADTCCMQVTVVWGKVVIEKVHDQIQGQFTDVDVMLGTNYPIGGFDLLIFYDASALSLQKVDPGAFITNDMANGGCRWEYFTYRFGANGNCGSACPSGYVRIVAMAETNNGDNHPQCFTNYPGPGIDSVVAKMRFLVSNDRTLECQYVPITFWWVDCGDNSFSNVKGDSLIISRYVYAYGGFDGPYYHIESFDPVFPTNAGAQEECDTHNQPGKPNTWRVIDFFNGGVDIVCADSIDARGDINLNGLSYEIADAVMFTNYFVYGFSAFQGHTAGSQAASDVNADGLSLSVADLVYLIRVLVGDAMPYPKTTALEVIVTSGDGVYTANGVEVGAVAMTVKGEVEPELLALNMDMRYAYENGITRIIILPQYAGQSSISGFTGDFVRVQGELVSFEAATILGQPIAAKLTPKAYALSQNYPNPFNPSTNIQFALPVAGEYTLTIYNVNGQTVKTFSGNAEAGWQTVVWNTSETNVASGVYFYRLNAGTYSSVKKMVLLK